MKKNKTVAYMLAATLLVGGTFLGTKAMFTDKVDVAGEVSISTGDVDIAIEKDYGWSLKSNGADDNKNGEANFDNLKTGDTLTKTVMLKNNGTLKAVVNLEKNKDMIPQLPEGFEYTAELMGEVSGDPDSAPVYRPVGKDHVMKSGETAKVVLKLEVTGGGQHNQPGSLNSDEQEQQIIDLQNSYILDATQVK